MTQRRVIVIGGGAAGLMAAGQAAELGAETPRKDEAPGKQVAHHR
jgi:predicted flavoprotein YhiN